MIEQIMQSEIVVKLIPLFTKNNINFFLFFILLITFLCAFRIIKNFRLKQKLYHIENYEIKNNKVVIKSNKHSENRYFRELRVKVHEFFFLKKKKDLEETIYLGILSIELLAFLFCLFAGKIIFALFIPIMIHFVSIKALGLLTVNIHAIIQAELPHAIKHMIKFLSKDSDLKTVIYEMSKTMKEPLRGLFIDLSRKLITDNYEESLMDFADEIDNIWIHAYVFLLISYREQSKKEDIVKNLRSLTDMMDKENEIMDKSLAENKPMAMVNYFLAILSILGFAANILYNPDAVDFFFGSIGGMMCVILGLFAFMSTFLLNLILTTKTEKG